MFKLVDTIFVVVVVVVIGVQCATRISVCVKDPSTVGDKQRCHGNILHKIQHQRLLRQRSLVDWLVNRLIN